MMHAAKLCRLGASLLLAVSFLAPGATTPRASAGPSGDAPRPPIQAQDGPDLHEPGADPGHGGISPGQLPTPRANLTAAEREEVFLALWDLIDRRYPAMSRRNVNWTEVRERYQPMLGTVQDDHEFRALLRRMLAELQDGHVRLVMPDGELAEPSVQLRQAGGAVVIAAVVPGSDAAAAGLVAGMELLSVDGEPVRKVWNQQAALTPASTEHGRAYQSARTLLQGRPDSSATVVGRSPDGTTVTATLRRTVPVKRADPEFERRTLDTGVLYLRINSFMPDVMRQMEDALREAARANPPGIIIDVRDNAGGQSSIGILSLLFSHPELLHYVRDLRTGADHEVLTEPVDVAYAGPVILLTNTGCVSSCEAFTLSLAQTGRATLVGERTSGAAFAVWPEALPHGYAIFLSLPTEAVGLDRQPVERRGVGVDYRISRTQEDWACGRDPALEKAVRLLTRGSRSGKDGP